MYALPLGEGIVRREGSDVTIVGASYMIIEALRAAEELEKEGIDAEVVDLRSFRPLDENLILHSVKKTGRLIIVDSGWKTGGVGAEIAAMTAEKGFESLQKPIRRIAALDIPTPAGHILEEEFYPKVSDIIDTAKELVT